MPLLRSIYCSFSALIGTLAICTSVPVFSQTEGEAQRLSFEQIEVSNIEWLNRKQQGTGNTLLTSFALNSIDREPFRAPNSKYGLMICQNATYWQGVDFRDDYPLYNALTTLTKIELYKILFSEAKIPPQIWSPYIEKMRERAKLTYDEASTKPLRSWEEGAADWEEFERPLLEALLADLNRYTVSVGRSSAEFAMGGGCGAGEIPLLIKTQPSGASVRIIPAFRYMLCQKQGINPNDLKSCRGWRSVSSDSGTPNNLAGEFYYTAVWPNGKRTTCNFAVTMKDQTHIIRETDCR